MANKCVRCGGLLDEKAFCVNCAGSPGGTVGQEQISAGRKSVETMASLPTRFSYDRPLRLDLTAAGLGLLCIFGFLNGWAGTNHGPIYVIWLISLLIAPLSFFRLIKRFVTPGFVELDQDAITVPGLFSGQRISYSDIESIDDRPLRGALNRDKRFLLIKTRNKSKMGLIVSSLLADNESYSVIRNFLESRSGPVKTIQ